MKILTHFKSPKTKLALLGATFLLLGLSFFFTPKAASAATMSITPSSGEFNVGDTFQVSVIVDTEGQAINTVEASLVFPADRLQIVSPTAGTSIINIYTTPPRFDNRTGQIDVAGGMPGGVTTSKGLITTLTFRARTNGTANIRFLDNSKALLHDGQGTNVLNSTRGAVYTLQLPPPNGPVVSSETHPDQEKWYSQSTAILSWQGVEGAEGYSYEISRDPISLPDNTIDSRDTSVIYKGLGDGVHYFHIKSLREGTWGGVTHFALKVDTTPPAKFGIDVFPGPRTNSERPVIEFTTTDQQSGISRYELKLVPLNQNENINQFFIETVSPHTPGRLEPGGYSIIVRAYDLADNYTEETQRLDISLGVSRYFGPDGLYLIRNIYIRWSILLPSLLFIILILLLLAIWFHRRHQKMETVVSLPGGVQQQLSELQKYRMKYGKLASAFLLLLGTFFAFGSATSFTKAQSTNSGADLTAPLITSYSEKITEQEIFYVSGRTSDPNTEVQLQLQNLYDGQTFALATQSDKRGDWFYQHDGFLTPGKYIVWAQAVRGNEVSPPSAQSQISVQAVALTLAGTRVTTEMLYVGAITILIFIIVLLASYLALILKASRKKQQLLTAELNKAEESVRQGFLALKRDLQLELALVRKAGLTGELAGEERAREEQIEKDLEEIEKVIANEITETKALEGVA